MKACIALSVMYVYRSVGLAYMQEMHRLRLLRHLSVYSPQEAALQRIPKYYRRRSRFKVDTMLKETLDCYQLCYFLTTLVLGFHEHCYNVFLKGCDNIIN